MTRILYTDTDLKTIISTATTYGEDWSRYLSREETINQLEEAGFLNGLIGDPTLDIGTAFKLASMYGLMLCEGLAFSNMKAYLPEEKWQGMPKDIAKQFIGWCDRFTVQAAVCHCLLICREQGLL